MPQEFYSENQAEEILRLATRQSLGGGLTREALLRTAAEVGLSEAEVDAAERQLNAAEADGRLAERFRLRQRGKFVQAAVSALGTWGLLIGIWWMSGHGYFWPGWVVVPMLFGGFDEIPKCLMPSSSSYQRAFAKWKAKGAPDVEPDDDEEEGSRHERRRNVVVGARVGRHRDRF